MHEGIEFDGTPGLDLGLGVAVLDLKNVREKMVAFGVVGIELGGAASLGLGAGRVPGVEEIPSGQGTMGFGKRRVEFEGFEGGGVSFFADFGWRPILHAVDG